MQEMERVKEPPNEVFWEKLGFSLLGLSITVIKHTLPKWRVKSHQLVRVSVHP